MTLGFDACSRAELPAETSTDTDVPAAGTGLFSLVAAENCRSEQETNEFQSSGAGGQAPGPARDGGEDENGNPERSAGRRPGAARRDGADLPRGAVGFHPGALRDAAGHSQNGGLETIFRFFDASLGGTEIARDEHSTVLGPAPSTAETGAVTVTGGLLATQLGSADVIGDPGGRTSRPTCPVRSGTPPTSGYRSRSSMPRPVSSGHCLHG